MANSASALKRVRQAARRTERNTALRSRVKTLRKQTLGKVESGDLEEAKAFFVKFSSAVDVATKKNIFHKNKAANLKSKTNKAIKAIASV